jgi:hypothetical protein
MHFQNGLLILAVLTLSHFLTIAPCAAETKTFIADATYTMGDGDTPAYAEAMALQQAKQNALEQAGTYIESYTKIRNYDLMVGELRSVAGGILQNEVLDKSRRLIGNSLQST